MVSLILDYSPPSRPIEDIPKHYNPTTSSNSQKNSISDQKWTHKREPSESSSILKPIIVTPSTTASNSPSNLVKTTQYAASQETNLGIISEKEDSQHSDDSGTESERHHTRKGHNISPCTHNNLINYSYHRPPADGSACASNRSSHLSLTSSSHGSRFNMDDYSKGQKRLQTEVGLVVMPSLPGRRSDVKATFMTV